MEELLHGDCLAILPTLPAQSVDLILVDLPYQKLHAQWDKLLPMDVLWAEYRRILKPSGVVVLTAVQPFTSLLICSNLAWYRYNWVWQKNKGTGFLDAKKRPLRDHEDIAVFSPHEPTYHPQMVYRPRIDRSGLKPTYSIHFNGPKTIANHGKLIEHQFPRTVLYFPIEWDLKERIHPTQKPVALFEYLIRTYTQPGALVLDHCAGSMTTAIACLRTNRRYLCIEQDDEYFRKGSERVAREWRKPVPTQMWETA